MISQASRGSNVILGGFMGTGKSSVGKRLAECLGYEFVDLDELIEADARLPIAQIFATRGEAAFRAMEREMVVRVSARERCVIATGGGALVEPRNLERLRRTGVVIALTASAEVILSRVGSGGDRPMLWGADPRQRVADLLAERTPAYSKADALVDTSSRSVDEVVAHILALLAGGPPAAAERMRPRCRPSG
jgi:shikimate kinase